MEQHLNKRDFLLIAICAFIGVLSFFIANAFFDDALPEATIDFKITREDARERAQSFLHQRGFDVQPYRHSAIFDFDNQAKTFLERERGLEGATDLIDNPVRLWRWSNRWFRDHEKEEFRVQFTTTGNLVGFEHVIEEKKEGKNLTQQSARLIAEQFITEEIGRDLATLSFVEAETTERPNRTDHTFTWKLTPFEVENATYRYQIRIQGDLIGSYNEYLKVPDAWVREYKGMRSYNETANLTSNALHLLLLVGMCVVLSSNFRAQNIRWKTVTVFSAIAFTLTFLAEVNTLPLLLFNFDTTETYGSFLIQNLLFGFLGALFAALNIGFLTAGTEPVYRKSYGNHISISKQFLTHGIRTKRFLSGTIIGLTMAAFFVAYQTVFYLVADKLGAWTPADIPYSDMVNTYIPWVFVLLIGFMPAVDEEFTFRAFAIPYLQQFLKKRWVAVLLAALVWGFAHAAYPQEPFYIRGVELGIAGIIIGYVMIKWGLLPVLVWHYTIDAFYTAMVLFRSSNSYFITSAGLSVGLALLPLVLAIVFYIRYRSFVDPTSLLNREDVSVTITPEKKQETVPNPTPEAQLITEQQLEHGYKPLSTQRLLLTTIPVLMVAGLFFIPNNFLEYDEAFTHARFAITAPEAETAARNYMAGRRIELEEFRAVVTPDPQYVDTIAKYVMEHSSFATVDSLYANHLPLNNWQVRFFRPLEKEEFLVSVNPKNAAIESFRRTVDEDESGADLPESKARILAIDHLQEFAIRPTHFKLIESSSEKKTNRRDHRFTWEALDEDVRNIGESRYRVAVSVIGDKASGLTRFIKLPEEWVRAREETSTFKAVGLGLMVLIIVGIVLHIFWILIRQMRTSDMEWRKSAPLVLLGSGFFLVNTLNNLPTYYGGYSTEYSLLIYGIQQGIFSLIGGLMIGLVVICYFSLADTLYSGCLDKIRGHYRAIFFRDAVWIAALAWLIIKINSHLTEIIARQFPEFSQPSPSLMAGLTGSDTLFPVISGLLNTITTGALIPILYGVVLYYLLQVLKKPIFVIGAVLAFLIIPELSAYNAGEFYLGIGIKALTMAITAIVIAFLLRGNIVAYVLLGIFSGTIGGSHDLIMQPSTHYQIHGWLWLSIVVIAVMTLWLQSRRYLPERKS